jgi:hypothetical protein
MKMMDMLRQTGRYAFLCGSGLLPFLVADVHPQTRICRRLVPLSSGVWLLAVLGRYQHPTELRAAHTPRRCRRRRPNPVRQGQSRH